MGAGTVAAPALGRTTLPSHITGKLFYAQVHEDPALEIAAFTPVRDGKMVVVSSGGCTALSLRAAGATDVIGVDLNATQNHMVELKAAACGQLTLAAAVEFLGGWSAKPGIRLEWYSALRPQLTPTAQSYWDRHLPAIARGVLGAGVSERFIAGVAAVMRLAVHPRSRIERMLACRSLDAQRTLYAGEWNSLRWRMLFSVLVSRRGLEHTYDTELCVQIEKVTVGRHFHALFEHALTALPVAENYFLHHALTGSYPSSASASLPAYLTTSAAPGSLALVDGAFAEYLRTQPAESISGFSLSNICEWLDTDGVDRLFAEIARTAVPGAVVCFRNFVGWTEVPARWRDRIVEDRAEGERLLYRDRSFINRRFAVCRVRSECA